MHLTREDEHLGRAIPSRGLLDSSNSLATWSLGSAAVDVESLIVGVRTNPRPPSAQWPSSTPQA